MKSRTASSARLAAPGGARAWPCSPSACASIATRAWFAYLDAWLFGTSIAVGALLVTMTGHATKASWMVVTRRPMESVAATLPLFALLFVPLAFGLDRIYPWADHGAAGAALAHALDHKRVWLEQAVLRRAHGRCTSSSSASSRRCCGRGRPRTTCAPSPALVRRMRRLSGGGAAARRARPSPGRRSTGACRSSPTGTRRCSASTSSRARTSAPSRSPA